MAAPDALPVLPEHDITVVNTFVQVGETRQKPRFNRASTAPVSALEEEMHQQAEDSAEGDREEAHPEEPEAETNDAEEQDEFLYLAKRRQAYCARVEETPADGEAREEAEAPEEAPAKMTVKRLQQMRTLNRFETPDPWDLEVLAKSLDEAPEETPSLPAKAASNSKPRFLHSATPDRWEWEAMAQEEKMIEPSLSQGPMADTKPKLPPTTFMPAPPPAPCVPQAAMQAPAMVSLLTVPVMTHLPQTGSPVHGLHMPGGSPVHAMQIPGLDNPRLLGSTSPMSQHGSPKPGSRPNSPSVSPRVRPGTLETTTVDEGRQIVKWFVDAALFDSNSERSKSPEFQLRFPNQPEPFNFSIMISAIQTGGKHGAGFKKARGRGTIELKCLSTVPSGVDSITALICVGQGSRKQFGAKPIEHSFGDKTCCQLRNGGEAEWDFKQSFSKEAKTCEISLEICI